MCRKKYGKLLAFYDHQCDKKKTSPRESEPRDIVLYIVLPEHEYNDVLNVCRRMEHAYVRKLVDKRTPIY